MCSECCHKEHWLDSGETTEAFFQRDVGNVFWGFWVNIGAFKIGEQQVYILSLREGEIGNRDQPGDFICDL